MKNATIHYNSTDSGGIGTSIPQAKKYTDVKGILSQSGSGIGNVYLTYDETKLSEASNVYNHQLARFSIGLSTMAYSTDSKMRDILEKLDYKIFSLSRMNSL